MNVDVSGEHQAYLDTFNRKSLSYLKRKIKKVEKSNTDQTSLRVFKNVEDVAEFIKIAKPISKVSYQGKLLGTVFRTDAEWLHELEELASQNRFRGYVLYASGSPIAYNYCSIYGDGIMLYDLSGYNPEYQNYSPGTVLQYYVIEQAFTEATVRFYDLCQGEGRHKEQFATASIQCCHSYILPNTPFNWLLICSHWLLGNTSDQIVSLLDRLGIKDRIKTYIRRRDGKA